MAQISIDIPAAILTRTTNGICNKFGYQDLINNQPNPETKSAFAKRLVAAQVKSWVVESELSAEVNSLRVTEQVRLDGELNIT